MKLLIFLLLGGLFGGLILTLIAKPLLRARNFVVKKINGSFEDEKETGKDGN